MCSSVPLSEEETDEDTGLRDLLCPRITALTKLLPELKWIPGFAFDLTTANGDGRPYYFNEKEIKDRALRRFRGRSRFV